MSDMDWVKTDVSGLKELKAKGGERAARAAAAKIRDQAKENCPSQTLIDTMTIVKVHKKGSLRPQYFITHKKKGGLDPFFAHMVEFGPINQPGGWDIFPKKAKKLGYEGRLGVYQRHPGYQPWPYMRDAFESEGEKSINVAAKRLDKFIKTGK